MHTSFIITFIGDDRPGLVEQLSAAIEQCGGNWHESRLAQLEGKFAGLVHVSLPQTGCRALEDAVARLSAEGLSVTMTPTGEAAAPGGARSVCLSVIGPDRPGIVREVSRALAQRQINVVEMDSAVSSAPMSAEMIFSARIEAQIPDSADLAELQENLEEIANNMTLEIDLE
ncbi:MAG: hypothetical protein CME59_09795 [Halioglobus sp.]|nr:hypothetical protein [Halioglobus sp.]